MTELITLTQAKQHLNRPLDVTLDDDALYLILELAHGRVLNECKHYCSTDSTEVALAYANVDAWTSDTAPAGVKAAILEEFGAICADRGDTGDRKESDRYYNLSPRAAGFLTLHRDPVLR